MDKGKILNENDGTKIYIPKSKKSKDTSDKKHNNNIG